MKIETEVTFPETEAPSKYIFIRIYNPVYINPFYYANILKGMIESTEVTDYTASHAAIGFSLEDSFYGLTGIDGGYLRIEQCTDTKSQVYMKECDPEKSEQITLAIKVQESEYNNVKKYVESCVENDTCRYDVNINSSIAKVSINRKFFAKNEEKQFGNVKYPEKKYKDEEKETKFVCCTFIAYALKSYVQEIYDWFEEKEIDFHLMTVTDLIFLPGAKKLFFSSWNDYNTAARTFAETNPDFLPYLNN